MNIVKIATPSLAILLLSQVGCASTPASDPVAVHRIAAIEQHRFTEKCEALEGSVKAMFEGMEYEVEGGGLFDISFGGETGFSVGTFPAGIERKPDVTVMTEFNSEGGDHRLLFHCWTEGEGARVVIDREFKETGSRRDSLLELELLREVSPSAWAEIEERARAAAGVK